MSDYSGWLLLSSDVRTFKGTKDRRFLVLRPSERAISIYKKQEDVIKAPSGVLDVTSYLIEKEYVTGHEHAFRVTTQRGPYLFAAENAKQLDGWFAAITAVGMRVATEPTDLARRKSRTKTEEESRAENQREKDEHEVEKQRLNHQKQKHILRRRHTREAGAQKRKSIRDEIEMEWRQADEKKKQEHEHKEEAEDLADKIVDKNSVYDLDELRRKKMIKQLARKHEKEQFVFQQQQSKKELKTMLKQQDELQKAVADQHEDEEQLLERQELDVHQSAQRRKKEYTKLQQKCNDELEKQMDAIQNRREKAQLAKAAALVIATQGAPSRAPPKPVEEAPEPQEEQQQEEMASPRDEPEPEAEPEAYPEEEATDYDQPESDSHHHEDDAPAVDHNDYDGSYE